MPLRWTFVPIAGALVWFGTLFLGLAGLDLLDRLCPPEHVVSGMCTASWHRPAVDGLTIVCALLAAVGIVLVPARIAPSNRFTVAFVAYLCGAAFAVYVATSGSMWGPFIAAAIGGSAALWFARRTMKAGSSTEEKP